MGKAIGNWRFFKCQRFDHTDEECDSPQGHVDHIQTVDLRPKDKKHHGDNDGDAVLPKLPWTQDNSKK
jgi:hypothetical protein